MSSLPDPIASAVVVNGTTTNRIKRVRRWRRRPADAPPDPKRYLADKSIRGEPYKVVCISLPVAFLERLDARATEIRKSRSHLIRTAVLKLLADGGAK